MKFSLAVVFASAVSSTLAYPHIAAKVAADRLAKRQTLGTIVPMPKNAGIPRPPGFPKFDPTTQLTSTTGDHAWIAPGPGDIRGPCAGLNAAANHGYLPRNGIADFASVETALFEAFGLDQTATEVLQQTTTFFDGDPITQKWSIGYHSDQTAALGPLESLVGYESGICAYGHLKSEGDASITRGDFYAPTDNSNCASYPQFMQELIDLAKANNGSVDMPVLAQHQHNRKLYSIANNPNYFSPAFAGVAFTPAAHHFVFQLMANHSAEYPGGYLSIETLMSFFSYTYAADGKTLQYTYGHERIPDNWYKRALDDPWTMPDILTAVGQQCLAFPTTCAIGGNRGTVNSFAGIDVGDVSSGAFNESTVFTDPNQLSCFLFQNIQAEAPSFLSKVFSGVLLSQVLGLVNTKLVPSLQKAWPHCTGLPAGKTMDSYASGFPGAKITVDGPRGASAY